MANFTERAIKEAFLTLLNERPLNKITVKDITDLCGINRNSFYYHFQDIPSLIQLVFTGEINRIIKEHPNIDSLESTVEISTSLLLNNRKAIFHIYNSVNRGMFEQYFWQVCEQTVNVYLKTAFSDIEISPEDKQVISTYYQCTLFGIVLGWLQRGMKDDINPLVKRLFELRHGFSEIMIQRCQKGGEKA